MKLVIDCREKELLKQINQQVLFTPPFKKIEVKTYSFIFLTLFSYFNKYKHF